MHQSQSKKVKKIILTGGHGATTALSVTEELIRRSVDKKPWEIYWVGSRYAMEGKNVPTLGSAAIPKLGVKFQPIVSGRLQTKFSLWTIPSLVKIPFGFFHALKILLNIKPDLILSFGGFAAYPVVVVGAILKVPIVLHEQTMVAGRANKMSAPFANKIALARRESKKYFPEGKCVVLGNPIMTQIEQIAPKEKLGIPPTIYITGGSTGAQAVNKTIVQILPQLLKEFKVVHHTGLLDFGKFKSIKEKLPVRLKKNYEVYDLIDPMQIDGVYKRADIIIARSGANTVSEIISTKRPAILIPLPYSYLDEQVKNAEFAKQFGIARVLEQDGLTPKKLFAEINDTRKNWKKIVEKVLLKLSPDKNAARKLVDLVEEVSG